MKIKKIIPFLLTVGILLGGVFLYKGISPVSGNHVENQIVSFFEADIDEDGKPELLTLHMEDPNQKTDLGDAYGNTLEISKKYVLTSNKEHIVSYEPSYSFDLTSIKPLRVRAGDINGDGKEEISIVAYKTTKFHPVMAKRPFFYALTDGKLEKIWLGSRLSRPFTDFVLYDIDKDQIDEILALEADNNDQQTLSVYDWEGFGFDLKTDYTFENSESTYSFEKIQHTPLEQLYLFQNQEKKYITMKEGLLCIEK